MFFHSRHLRVSSHFHFNSCPIPLAPSLFSFSYDCRHFANSISRPSATFAIRIRVRGSHSLCLGQVALSFVTVTISQRQQLTAVFHTYCATAGQWQQSGRRPCESPTLPTFPTFPTTKIVAGCAKIKCLVGRQPPMTVAQCPRQSFVSTCM